MYPAPPGTSTVSPGLGASAARPLARASSELPAIGARVAAMRTER